MAAIADQADQVRQDRRPAAEDNGYLQLEKKLAALVEGGWNFFRTMRDAAVEQSFYATYASPAARSMADGVRPRIAQSHGDDLRAITDVSRALESIEMGGYPNALVRMLILLARSRGSVRRDRLDRSKSAAVDRAAFADLSPVVRSRIIRQQSLIVEFEPDLALSSLAKMLPTAAEREMALRQAQFVLGDSAEMSSETQVMLAAIKQVLGAESPRRQEGGTRPPALNRRTAMASKGRKKDGEASVRSEAGEAEKIENGWRVIGTPRERKVPKKYKYIEELAHLEFELIKLQEWVSRTT